MKARKKRLDVHNKVIKQVITGSAVPKSIGFIELEKNYVLLAKMMTGMIDQMEKLETKMERMEKNLVNALKAARKSRF
jgi:hypothetical protein